MSMASLLDSLDDAQIPISCAFDELQRRLICVAIVGRNCFLYAVKLYDYNALPNSGFKRRYRFAAHQQTPAGLRKGRSSEFSILFQSLRV